MYVRASPISVFLCVRPVTVLVQCITAKLPLPVLRVEELVIFTWIFRVFLVLAPLRWNVLSAKEPDMWWQIRARHVVARDECFLPAKWW